MENSGSLKDQIAQRIKEANNVLVTVSNDPSVDQLAGAIGLTLLLNKLGKHGTAVFSGQVPSTIGFLEPEKTLEKDTNSLRDFIISLDKSKADKLRYKVEDKLVKIFITPYKTSLSDKDLIYSQGDFNVDVVIALGVKKKEQLDQAIVAHGRILHDATVISINTNNHVELGTMNLVDEKASSLCEIVVSLVEAMQSSNLLDGQMATAFLTGIVAETDRFRNNKTTSSAMSISSKLMTAGANQQLIASKLEQKVEPPKIVEVAKVEASQTTPDNNGALNIVHENRDSLPDIESSNSEETEDIIDQINIDEQGQIVPAATINPISTTKLADTGAPKFMVEPPAHGGTLTASSQSEDLDPSTDALTLPEVKGPLLNHDNTPIDENKDSHQQKPDFAQLAEQKERTLTDLENYVESPHVDANARKGLSLPNADNKALNDFTNDIAPGDDSYLAAARNAVSNAVTTAAEPTLEPIAALNASPVNLDLGHIAAPVTSTPSAMDAMSMVSSADSPTGTPKMVIPNTMPLDNTASPDVTLAPPPVPPPMMPQNFDMPAATPISASDIPKL